MKLKLIVLIGWIVAGLNNFAASGTSIGVSPDYGVLFGDRTNGNANASFHGFQPKGTQNYVEDTPDDTLTDDAQLLLSSNARDFLRLKKGTHNYNTNFTLSVSKTLKLDPGAIIKPASGIIFTITGNFDAPESYCIDETAGGRVIFSLKTTTPKINAMWWGPDNTGGNDATTVLRKWLSSGVAALNIPYYLPNGQYLISDELTLSNRVRVIGNGSAGGSSQLLVTVGANKAAMVVKSGANNVEISRINFSASSSSGTNSNAIRLEDDCDSTIIQYNNFSSFKGFAIYSAGSPTIGNLYTKILDNQCFAGNNATGTGNGLWPSGFVHSTNVFNQTLIARNTVKTSDMAYLFHGGALTNCGNIIIEDDALEALGANGLNATNVIAGDNLSQLTLTRLHIENNLHNNNLMLRKSKILSVNSGVWSCDFQGTIKVTNSVYLDSVLIASFNSTRFNNCFSNYIVNLNPGEPVQIDGARFFDAGQSVPITDEVLGTKIVGPYSLSGRPSIAKIGSYPTPFIASGANPVISIGTKWKRLVSEEFYGGAVGSWSAQAINSGAANAAGSGESSDFGMFTISTGVLTNGGAAFRGSTTSGSFGTSKIGAKWRIKTPSALSASTDVYRLWIGFGDTTSASEHVDGAYFEYTHSLSNGVWCAKTANNSSRTFASGASSTVTVVANTFYDLLLEGNSSAVNFWVSNDDGTTWTWIGFSATDIPTSGARLFGPHAQIIKEAGSVGTTAEICSLGRFDFWRE